MRGDYRIRLTGYSLETDYCRQYTDNRWDQRVRPLTDGVFAGFDFLWIIEAMPSRNTVRIDMPDSYYHVYARGINKDAVFLEDEDKEYFLNLLPRHLLKEPQVSSTGHKYYHARNEAELLALCIMDNHYHFLFYQLQPSALSKIMKSITVAYTAYFNQKYQHIGPIFAGRFRASLVLDDVYLLHVSRYIHLNPRSWRRYPFSSLRLIEKGTEPEWLETHRLLEQHPSRKAYIDFVRDYEDYKKSLDQIKHDLANL